MITTMFGADDAQLDALRSSGQFDPTAHGLASVDLGGVSPVALVTLDSAITGAPYSVVFDAVPGQPLEVVDEGEQLLFAVRPELKTALRSGGSDLIRRVGRDWAQSEEMQLDRWDAERCRQVVHALCSLAATLPSETRLFVFLSV